MNRTTAFTCSIYPDLTRVWHHFVRKYTDSAKVAIVIYDCGSRLDHKHFPGATIVRHANTDHGQKIDDFVARHADSALVFLMDDDTFVLDADAEPMAADALLACERSAALSFKPRGWWELEIDGTRHPVMGSYSLVFKPDVIRREKLSFRTVPTDDPRIRCAGGYYDTADFANEQLIVRGYDIIVPEQTVRSRMVRSYSAVSSGFVNFARRTLFSSRYRLTRSWEYWAGEIGSNLRTLEWACGVAGTISLYRSLFGGEPQFSEFFTYADLSAIAERSKDKEHRGQATAMVAGYGELLQTLEGAA